MTIPWSGFTKKRNYTVEKDRLQYKDLANNEGQIIGLLRFIYVYFACNPGI
jgi:hypothetical protein